jgi:N-methylhydantoinase B
MIGSARVGERRMQGLLAEYGQALALAAVEGVLDGAERQARACIAGWKDGVYRGEAIIDDDGHGFEDIWIRATVTKRGSDVTVDLSDSHPQVHGFINSSYPNMRAAVCMALAYLIDPHTPKNDGAFRSLSVVAREGTVVWARPGAPVTLCTNHCAQEVMEAVIKALAPACPDRAMAGWGRRFRIAIQGEDPRTRRPFIWHMFHARPGGGASSAGDGWPTAGEWQAAGGIKFGSVEVTEVRFPLFFRRHEFRPDSGGDGRYRGGAGTSMELVVEIDQPARANTAGDGVRHGACGLFGGGDGLPHRYVLRSRGRPDRVLRTKEVGIVVRARDVIHVESGGGGGWGDPRQRAAAAREEDRVNGFVTAGRRATRRAGAQATSSRPRTASVAGGRRGAAVGRTRRPGRPLRYA